ncbi:MAG: 8-oxo-dGTP diphosphatase, partial [Lachnospiraceae bacterium]|nr:8-oxo-dGTP diphosphatase [Lachnospiraceae bacterium]
MLQTTLCYLERDGQYLMLHRIKKEQDINQGKWIGVGGKLEARENPEQAIRREITEETGLTVRDLSYRGRIDFYNDICEPETIHLYTSDSFTGELSDCNEGVLRWVPKEDIFSLNLWEGDRIFLRYLMEDHAFFHLELRYHGDELL